MSGYGPRDNRVGWLPPGALPGPVELVWGSPPPGYHAPAVSFDGSTWGSIAALASADSPLLTVSMWALIPTAQSLKIGDFVPPPTVSGGSGLYFDTSGILASIANDNLGVYTSPGAFPFDAAWHHILASADASGVVIAGQILLDGVSQTVAPGTGPITMLFHSQEFAFSDDPAIDPPLLTGSLADCMFYPGQYLTDVTIFRDPITGKPKNPTGFPQGAIMLSGNAATFFSNTLGTEGPLTLQAGTITNAATSPSD